MFRVEVMVTVKLFGMWVGLVVQCGGTTLLIFSFSVSSLKDGAPDTEEVWREEVETGEDANDEGEEEGEQYEEVDNDELRSTVSARSFTGFPVCSILNSDQSKVLERPSRLRSQTRLLRGSEVLLPAGCLLSSDLRALRLLFGSGVDCELDSNITWAFIFSSGRDLNEQNTHM